MIQKLKDTVKLFSNYHLSNERPDIFLFATPRGGSTWLMELICTQPGFRYCAEPLNIRSEQVRKYLGVRDWEDLYTQEIGEKYQKYFGEISKGKVPFLNPNPFKKYYRPISNRLVFKIIHGGVDRINWFRDTFHGRILYCLRHPVPVTLSRKKFPFLNRFIESNYQELFSMEQRQLVARVIDQGDKLQQGIVAWCIHNAIPIKHIQDDWAVVTYEQLVVDPSPIINYLCVKLDLEISQKIVKKLRVPSSTAYLSSCESKTMLKEHIQRNCRGKLIERWKSKVTDDDLEHVQEILDVFEIDVYMADQVMPNSRYLVGSGKQSNGM